MNAINRKIRCFPRACSRKALMYGLLAASSISLGAVPAMAQGRFRTPTELDRIRLQEERERLEKHIQSEMAPKQDHRTDSTSEVNENVDIADGEQFLIDTIELAGDDSLSDTKRGILAGREGTRMGTSQIIELIRDLTNAYASDGYVTTTVTLLPQNLRDGRLVLRVQWGLVKGWRIQGPFAGTWRERALLAALPERGNHKLNIRDIDQAVEVLNNGALEAKVNITPSEVLGQSYIDVVVQDAPGIGAMLSIDNSGVGDDNAGRYRGNLNWTIGGIGADVWSVGGTKRYFGDESGDLESSESFSGTVPFGYWELGLRHGQSRYRRLIRTAFGSYGSEGDSQDQSLRVSRVLRRSGSGKTTGTFRVDHRDSNNYLSGYRLDVNSKRYTDMVLGVSHIDKLLGGPVYTDLNWGQGSRWLGANDLAKPKAGKTPALYHKVSGNVSWSRGWLPLGHRLDYSMRMGWQYASHPMLTANKLSLGDEYTVRGFKGESVYGDSGIYVSNTVQAPIGNGVSLFAGLDAGGVVDSLPGARAQYLSGWSLGLRAQWRNAGVSLTSATPIRAEPWMTGRPVVYVNGNVRF